MVDHDEDMSETRDQEDEETEQKIINEDMSEDMSDDMPRLWSLSPLSLRDEQDEIAVPLSTNWRLDHPETPNIPASSTERRAAPNPFVIEDVRSANQELLEEYKTWKKNSPFLYDIVLSTALDWPTLTTQWFPDVQIPPDKDYCTHRLLIGTHTEGGAPNYLQIAQVQLPKSQKPKIEDYDEETGEIGGYGGGRSKNTGPSVKFTIIQKIDHPGEVNKARYQPQNPNLIATMCTDGKVMIWDRTKHQSVPPNFVNPQIELHGHTREGFGLNWSPHEAGKLATAAEDSTVQLWDLNLFSKTNKILQPVRSFTHHTAVVNDVQYHPRHQSLIGTVSDDLTLKILDTRQETNTEAARSVPNGHRDAINAIAFNPKAETLLATGSADRTIGIWDLRYLKDKLHTLEGHNDTVTSLEWHPDEEYILGSGSYDRRVIFWDLSQVGNEQTDEEKEDGVPEMLFMHGGHTNRISDFSFNKNDPWVVCSAAEDNLIQVWKPSMAIVTKDLDDTPNDELEQ